MTFKVLLQSAQVDLFEQRSRFIGLGYPCSSLAQFEQLHADVKAEYPDANHVTYAYRIKDEHQFKTRFSDAGEPSGTAGRPILNHIEGSSLINTVVFVVRYFGGIKLGTGGLVRAYGNTARMVLMSAPVGEFIEWATLNLTIPYHQERQVEFVLQKFSGRITNRVYTDQISLEVMLPEADRETFLAALNPHSEQ